MDVLLLLCDVIEELSPSAVFHHQEEVLRGLNYLVELDEIWMAN